MIKGVSRQIIEVSETGNIYYEKAWLVVRSEYAQTEGSLLESQAQKLVREMDTPSSVKSKHPKGYTLLRMGLSAFVGSGITMLIQALIS